MNPSLKTSGGPQHPPHPLCSPPEVDISDLMYFVQSKLLDFTFKVD